MSTLNMNGRQRKSLAEQIDRLDRMLDGLADGLNEAIASAVQLAVKQVLVEVLSSAELQARLQPTVETGATTVELPTTASPVVESATTRVVGVCQRLGSWVKARLMAAGKAVSTAAATVVNACRQSGQRLVERCVCAQRRVRGYLAMVWLVLFSVRHLAGAVLTATAAGAAIGVTAFYLSPVVAALTSGASGFVATLAVHVALWLRQALVHWSMTNR